MLGHDDRIVRLKPCIFGGILAFDHFFVVEGDARLCSVGILPQDINGLFLCKIAKASSHCDRVEYGGSARQWVRAWLYDLSHNVEFLTVDLLDYYRHFRFRDVVLKTFGNLLFQLEWRAAPGLQ